MIALEYTDKNLRPKRKLNDLLPQDIANTPNIQLFGDKQITVDGCKGVDEYSDLYIKIKTNEGLLTVGGRYLNIKLLTVTSIIVEGKILSVEFEDWR
ncbi:MAG: YabP/YqfC family sporulation protein [Acutalibacteraceae bacterium]|nr:YabP/YqfC family sporulation protein [Clostridia bacterium]MEE3451715.1 YabP/YqfC family sporulation protein [Acutalibacteraceae bacterium]